MVARIDEAACIGCALCLKACPADAIVGGAKAMHTVIDAECTGCELCIPACPVDCISMLSISGAATGWAAWNAERAERGRNRYEWHRERLTRDALEHDTRLAAAQPTPLRSAATARGSESRDAPPAADKSGVIRAALERARARRST